MENIILFADDSRGIYIPQYFAESIKREYVTGVDDEAWDILLAGHEHDLYWDVWQDVLDSAVITIGDREYMLHQAGDLFLVDHENMTAEEKRNMFEVEIYDEEEELKTAGIEVPNWIEEDITFTDVMSIQQGGCSSGAYMPAVTYYQARETMNEHGDDVLDYIENALGEVPGPPNEVSWSGIAVHYLSVAVELWAGSIDVEEYTSE